MHKYIDTGAYTAIPVRCAVAAISAGVCDGIALLDLPYEEDFRAALDFNVVGTELGEFVELQGTGESHPFSRDHMNEILDLCQAGLLELFEAQRTALAGVGITAPVPAPAS